MNNQIMALDFIARCLGIDRRAQMTAALRSEITSGCLVWETVVSLANQHLVTSALWIALNDRGLIEYLPDDLSEYLRELHRLNKRRNEHLKAQVIEAVGQLNGVGIESVLLKGAVHLFANTFTDLGVRMMMDIDILVPKQHLNTSLRVLHDLGYHTPAPLQRHYTRHHHCAPLFRPGEYGGIEVHRDLLSQTISRILPTETAWAHVEPLIVEGLTIRVLSPTYRVLHNILHSEMADRSYEQGLINLRSLHDLVSINRISGKAVDWLAIRGLMDRHGKGRVLRAYVYLAHRLFGMAMPQGISPIPRSTVHYVRSRAQLKWTWAGSLNNEVQQFSAHHIRRRYRCGNSLVSLTMGRLRYIGHLLFKYSGRAMTRLLGSH